jgi:hypothetical protein
LIGDPTAAMNGRRFPAPWSVEEQQACFDVRDHNEHHDRGRPVLQQLRKFLPRWQRRI